MVSRSLTYRFLIDLIYPNRCPLCGRVMKWDRLFCGGCESKLTVNTENVKTGVENADYEFSPLIFESNSPSAELIYRLKHKDKSVNFVEYCTRIISERLAADGITGEIDLICAVPMNIGKKFRRGYNQAEVIGKFLSSEVHKPVDFTQLKREDDGVEQHMLKAEQRRVHAEKIYKSNPRHRDITGKNILLCDDVITTGSSMSVCAGLLKAHGAARVFCVSCETTYLKENNFPKSGENTV